MTVNMTRLIEDATKAGYTVEQKGSMTSITKRVGRWKKPVGISVSEDGTAFDVTVDLGVAKGIRSYKVMRKVLGI